MEEQKRSEKAIEEAVKRTREELMEYIKEQKRVSYQWLMGFTSCGEKLEQFINPVLKCTRAQNQELHLQIRHSFFQTICYYDIFLHIYLQNCQFITSRKAEMNTWVENYSVSYYTNLKLGHKCSLSNSNCDLSSVH